MCLSHFEDHCVSLSMVHDLRYALESPGELKYLYLVHHRLIKSESMGPDLQNVLKVLLRNSNMKLS